MYIVCKIYFILVRIAKCSDRHHLSLYIFLLLDRLSRTMQEHWKIIRLFKVWYTSALSRTSDVLSLKSVLIQILLGVNKVSKNENFKKTNQTTTTNQNHKQTNQKQPTKQKIHKTKTKTNKTFPEAYWWQSMTVSKLALMSIGSGCNSTDKVRLLLAKRSFCLKIKLAKSETFYIPWWASMAKAKQESTSHLMYFIFCCFGKLLSWHEKQMFYRLMGSFLGLTGL